MSGTSLPHPPAPPAALSSSAMVTPRLQLRLLHADAPGDEALYVHLYTAPAVMRRIVAPLSFEAAARSFRAACRHNQRDVPGQRYWRIDWRGPDAAPDGIGMAVLQRDGAVAELGVMLRHGWWNRGVSSEAFVVVLDHAFTHMGLDLVHAERPDDDHALVIDRLLDRFGFVRAPERASAPGQCRWELPRARWVSRVRIS